MSATTDLVDAMSDDLSPIEEVKEEVIEVEAVEAEETKTEEVAEETDEDDGYTIDDDAPEVKEEKVVDAPKPTQLNTEQQYIYENLPTLSIMGKDGNQYNIKVPNELPADFEFANMRDQLNFNSAIASQELKANNLQNTFQNQASQKSAEEYATREDRAIVDDISTLQKSGDLSNFKKQPSDADFDSDPTAILVNSVREFMNKKNQDYLARSQAGQAYRHIGFEEAFYAYKRANPEVTRSAAQTAEDKQRKEVGRNVSSKGTKTSDVKRPQMRSGMNTRDIYAMIDSMDD